MISDQDRREYLVNMHRNWKRFLVVNHLPDQKKLLTHLMSCQKCQMIRTT